MGHSDGVDFVLSESLCQLRLIFFNQRKKNLCKDTFH